MNRRYLLTVVLSLFVALALSSVEAQQKKAPQKSPPGKQREGRRREDAAQRAKSLRAICKQLNVSTGDAIADIGAGSGRDSWVFAGVVGESGKVFSEEIEQGMVDKVTAAAKEKGLPQVQGVLGGLTSPELPADSVDMAFMHHVYHHVSKPREMLRSIWASLKPGGYLVIVDRRRGTLVDWVPRENRTKKHYWIAETTVVREARESGYRFVDFAESAWHQKESFVLVFQRPEKGAANGDPDPLSPIPTGVASQLLPADGKTYQRVAFVALGEGRSLISPVLKATSCPAIDIILEEWATQKDERPETPQSDALTSILTDKGDPKLGPDPIDAVYFLDTYHLLFHGPTLLDQLRDRLTEHGRVFVLDRAAQELSHREASHRRKISPELVREEMEKAGFGLVRIGPKPTEDRFLFVFAKK